MTETFNEFDPSEYLDSPEAIAEFISDALETQDAAYITKAMGVVARAKGITELFDFHASNFTVLSATMGTLR